MPFSLLGRVPHFARGACYVLAHLLSLLWHCGPALDADAVVSMQVLALPAAGQLPDFGEVDSRSSGLC